MMNISTNIGSSGALRRFRAVLYIRHSLRPAAYIATMCIAAAASLAGCISPSDPPGNQLDGCWREKILVMGSSLMIDLSHNNTGITGSGTYSLEAGRSGSLSVTGTRSGSVYTLDLAFDYGYVEHLRTTAVGSTQFIADVVDSNGRVQASGLVFGRCP